MKHIFVATPMYGGLCYGFYMQSGLKLQTMCKDSGLNLSFSMLFNESLIQRARNLLAANFLKSDATHLMFIDADILFRPEDIFPMLEADKDIICGIYPKKEINWQHWWPFDRATGTTLRQLNRKPKQEYEEALL